MSVDLETDRLILSPLELGDAPALYHYRSDPDGMRYQGWQPSSVAEVEQFIEQMHSAEFDTAGTWFQLAIRRKPSLTLLGDLGVHFLTEGSRQVEFGVTVAQEHQGRGIATEAVAGLISHLFGALDKHRVFASVDPRNHPSIRLMRRLGLRQEGHLRESQWFKGEWVDDLLFATLRREWDPQRIDNLE